MVEKVATLVKEVTTAGFAGTGPVQLAGIPSDQPWSRSFANGIGDGNSCEFVVRGGNGEWERVKGTLTAGSPDTLSRVTVIENHLGTTAKINFTAGFKDVYLVGPSAPRWLNTQVLTSGDTYTPTPGTRRIRVRAIGGGGGGGGSDTAGRLGNGGGGGGYCEKSFDITGIATVTYAIGAAGAAGAAAAGAGGDGGDTTWDSPAALTAAGGGGGGGDNTSSPGAAGTAAGGDINLEGEEGGAGGSDSVSTSSGTGGAAGGGYGSGGRVSFGNAGGAGKSYGGGGGGGHNSTGNAAGGAGAAGAIIVDEFA